MAWYRNAQGQPVWRDDAPKAVPVGPRNPRLPAQIQSDVLGNAQTQANTGRTVVQTQGDRIDNATKLATQGAMIRKAQAEAAAAEAAARSSQQERAAKLAPLNALNKQLRTAWDAFAAGPGSTKGLASISDYNPFDDANATFDSAAAGLAEIGLNAFRTPGVGSQSDNELKAFVQANRPSASDVDAAAMQKFRNLENRLAEAYKAHGIPYTPYRPEQFREKSGGPAVIKYDKNGNRIR